MSSQSTPAIPSTMSGKLALLETKRSEMEKFTSDLVDLQTRLVDKQTLILTIIERRVADHHALLDKWATRWKTTVQESIEEKCEKLAKQQARFERKLEKLTAFWRQVTEADEAGPPSQSSTPGLMSVSPSNNGMLESNLSSSAGNDLGSNPGVAAASSTADRRHERHAEKWLRKEYQLRPDGMLDVELKETMQEVEDDFNLVLSESKSSLKRSLVFVGGIIRGYLRRGRNREFIRTMRRLESRSKQNSEELEEAGLHGLVAPMQAYIAPPRLTINVVRRTVNVWDTIAKLWQFRHEQALIERLAAQLYDHAEHDAHKIDFYVPQLANVLLQLPVAASGGGSSAGTVLERFIMHRAAQSMHFALRVFLAVRAALHDHATQRADDESESEPSELSELSDDADSSPRHRGCLWCRKCHALLASVRSAAGSIDATLRPSLRSELSNSGGGSGGSLRVPSSGSASSIESPSPASPRRASPINPLPKALRDMRLKVKGSFHGEVDVNVGGVKHWHRHEADVTGNSFSISVDSGSTSQSATVEKAEWRRGVLGPSMAYFDNQLVFLEKLVNVSRELQQIKSSVLKRRDAAKNGGGSSRAKQGAKNSAVASGNPTAATTSSSSSTSAGANEVSEALAVGLKHLLEALAPSVEALGGVSVPLDDGGKTELPARLVQICSETALPIATSNRMLFAVEYEQVAAPTSDGVGEFDDVHLRSADSGFALERRRRSEPTTPAELPLARDEGNSAALPAVAVVIKQSYNSGESPHVTTTAQQDGTFDDADDASSADESRDSNVLRGAFGTPWSEHLETERHVSPFANRRGWSRRRIIVKYGDSLMQEQLAMQLLRHTVSIFEEFNLDLPLLTYDIVATTAASGVIECVPNAVSLDSLRQRDDWTTLPEFFEGAFGPRSAPSFASAHSMFVRSNAAYSVVSFVLQIKDRHNANVLLTSSGQLCHIDFGFVLTHTVAFEKAPFKLTEDVVNVFAMTPTGLPAKSGEMQGFALYCSLCVQGYLAVRRRADRLLLLLEMSRGFGRCYPGLDSPKAVDEVRARLHLDWSERKCAEFVLNLIADARDNWRTTVFDSYQQIVNDIS